MTTKADDSQLNPICKIYFLQKQIQFSSLRGCHAGVRGGRTKHPFPPVMSFRTLIRIQFSFSWVVILEASSGEAEGSGRVAVSAPYYPYPAGIKRVILGETRPTTRPRTG
jgi:hypothetical protein